MKGKKRNPVEVLASKHPWIRAFVLAGIAVVVIRAMKKNQGTLAGNPDGLKMTFDQSAAVKTLMAGMQIPAHLRPLVQERISRVLSRMAGVHGINTR